MKKGYIVHIENETLTNTDYRRVLYTAEHMQLVLMSINPGEEIGEEVHHLDQFIRIDQGEVTVILNDEASTLGDGDAVLVPSGTKHNVINSGNAIVKLYTLYGPPEHKDGIVRKTKKDADEQEEHYDNKTTE